MASAQGSGASLSNAWDRFSNNGLGASQFSADGSAASQFTMPGGQVANYQGVQALPATLGGVNGVQDAQDWTQAIKDSGPGVDWSKLAGAGAGLGEQAAPPHAPGVGRGGGGGAVDFNPAYLNAMPAAPGQAPQANVDSLMKMILGANKGYAIK